MPEPLKNLYSEQLVKSLAKQIKRHYPQFDSRGFNRKVLDDEWSSRELKQRMRHISLSLGEFLPKEFSTAIEILAAVLTNFWIGAYVFS